MGTLTNGPVQNKPFLFKTETSGNAQVQMIGLDDETVTAIGAIAAGAGSTTDRELRVVDYIANASGTGYTAGDAVVRADMYDVTGATPSLIATIWFNATQGTALGTAPTQANLTFVGTKDAATQTTLAAMNAAVGAQADTVATTDTGTFSLIALIKRLLGKFPALGAATSANSIPVVLATDEALPLPTGAATGAKQDTGNTSLASIDTKLTHGQANAAGSLSVVLSSDGPFATNFGLQADTAATSDTGSFSFVAFVKRGLQNWTTLLAKIPALGQGTKSASIPVTLASDQGNVSIAEGQVSTVTETTVSASATIATLLAASAGRRGFRLTVPKAFTGTCGLSTNGSQTLANCPIQLSGGDTWVENLAAASAWYVILDTSTATIPVQALS